MYKYISWDPGESTGVVVWNEEGKPVKIEQINQEELDEFLIELENTAENISTFVIEEYRVFSHVPHAGSKIHTIQVIGQLKAFARKYNIKIVEQRADIKKVAAIWAGVKVPKGHMSDRRSAYLHGYYHLHKIGVIKARVLDS